MLNTQQVVARGRNVCTSASSSSTSSTQPELRPVPLPDSQQAAVKDAVTALVPLLQPALASSKPVKRAKGFTTGAKPAPPANRFAIELPLADAAPQTSVQLTADILSAIKAQLRAQAGRGLPPITLVMADEAAVEPARRASASGVLAAADVGVSRGSVYGLREACRQSELAGMLVVVAPTASDVALLEQLLDEVWAGPAALVLNPEWAVQGVTVPQEYRDVLASIAVAYSFTPCAIKGLLGNKEGAVLRMVEKGTPEAKAPWRILYKLNDQFVQVGTMNRRPRPDDLELAFLNASAATSPITKTVKFFKGFGGKK